MKYKLLADDFKIIADFPMYSVSKNGDVFNIHRNKKLRTAKNNHGYILASLFRNGFNKTIAVHRLVAIAFIPNPNNLEFVNHINGIKCDNRVENLEWCSRIENAEHAKRMGLFACGERNKQTKVTPAIQKRIVDMRNNGIFFTTIGQLLSLDRKTISKQYHAAIALAETVIVEKKEKAVA